MTKAQLRCAALLSLLLGSACELQMAELPLEEEAPEAPQGEVALATSSLSATTPPAQPASGPGGSDYPATGAVTTSPVTIHSSALNTSVTYYRASTANLSSRAPLLFYIGGGGPLNDQPGDYKAMLDHFARKGYLVVYGVTKPAFTAGKPDLADDVLAEILMDAFWSTGYSRRVVYAGHSLGGPLALRVAILAQGNGYIPKPAAIVLHEPSDWGRNLPGAFQGRGFWDLTSTELAKVDAQIKLLFIQAQFPIETQPIIDLWNGLPSGRVRNFLRVPVDGRFPPLQFLMSDHFSPSGFNVFRGAEVNTIDWWGYWRPTEGAFAEALGLSTGWIYAPFCTARDNTLSGTYEGLCDTVRDMGTWSDGQPFTRIRNWGDLKASELPQLSAP